MKIFPHRLEDATIDNNEDSVINAEPSIESLPKKKKDKISQALNHFKRGVNQKDVIFVESFDEEKNPTDSMNKFSHKCQKMTTITLFTCLLAIILILTVLYVQLKGLMNRKDQMYGLTVPSFLLHEVANHTSD